MKQESSIKAHFKAGPKARVALVVSRFNEEICEGLLNGALQALKDCGFKETQADVYRVPGAFEIPLIAKKCARSKKYKGIVCLGAVIRGETPHFEYVSQSVTDGLGRVALDAEIPVGFGVITVNNLDQAKERAGADSYNKGREAVLAVLETAEVADRIKKG